LNCTSTSASYWITVSKNLPSLICVLPVYRTKAVLNGLLKFAMQCADNGNEILCDIKACKENQVVFDCLLAHLPTFDSPADLLHMALSSGIVDQRFYGRISRNFDFWMECSGLAEEKLATSVDKYIEETTKS
ncbi:hypothetical protein TELCIR_15134, partial [Teladorsagia circumcincta]